MTALEFFAVAFSVACVVLAAFRRVGTWPAGIVAVVAYFIVFVHSKLYADAALQVVFLAQGIYGWTEWMGRGRAHGEDTRVNVLPVAHRAVLVIIVGTAALGIGAALARYTDASRPYMDSTVSVLSLAANWLLARRMIENWAVWLTADVLYVGLFLSKGLVASAALYALFLVLAVAGWRTWLRSMSPTERRGTEWAY